MYRYEFVEENVSTFLAAGNKITGRYADQGFRYAGYIPTSYSTGGLPKAFDLIFEKEGAGLTGLDLIWRLHLTRYPQ